MKTLGQIVHCSVVNCITSSQKVGNVYVLFHIYLETMTQKSSGKVVFHLEKYYLEIPVSNNVTNVVMVNTYNTELVKIQTMQVIHTYDIGDDE